MTPSELTAPQWAATAGKTPEWDAVLKNKETLMFRRFEDSLRRLAPTCAGDERAVLDESAQRVRTADAPVRRELARAPAFDSLVNPDFRKLGAEARSEWIAAVSATAAAAAVLGGETGEVPLWVGPGGRVHLASAASILEFPVSAGFRVGRLKLRRGRAVSPAPVRAYALVKPGLHAESSDPMIARLHHAPKELAPARAEFVRVMAAAVEAIARVEPATAEEFGDLVRLLVPLDSSDPKISLSSSYGNGRGAIFLSHHADVPLQFETLIHEFSHQKLEVLDDVDPLLIAGQDNAVFYSPWRSDPRPLRGLLVGAHAFVNVLRHYQFLSRALAVDPHFQKELDSLLCRRVLQCRQALDTFARHARTTEFGGRFLLHLWRDLARIDDRLAMVPRGIRNEAVRDCLRHKRAYGTAWGDLHGGAVGAAGMS